MGYGGQHVFQCGTADCSSYNGLGCFFGFLFFPPLGLWELRYLKSFIFKEKTVPWALCFTEDSEGELRVPSPFPKSSIEVEYQREQFPLIVAREQLFSRNAGRFIFICSINGISLEQRRSSWEKGAYKTYIQQHGQKDVTGKLPKQAGLLRCWRAGSPVHGEDSLFLHACQPVTPVHVLLNMAVSFALNAVLEVMLQKPSNPAQSGWCRYFARACRRGAAG